METKVFFEFDHKFIKRIALLAKLTVWLICILNIMTLGLMRKRLEYRVELVAKIVSEALAESIRITEVNK